MTVSRMVRCLMQENKCELDGVQMDSLLKIPSETRVIFVRDVDIFSLVNAPPTKSRQGLRDLATWPSQGPNLSIQSRLTLLFVA
jgi:hypothetical protein